MSKDKKVPVISFDGKTYPKSYILKGLHIVGLTGIISVLVLTSKNYLSNLYINSQLNSIIPGNQLPNYNLLILTTIHVAFPYLTLYSRIFSGNINYNYPRIGQKSVSGMGLRFQSAYENYLEHYPVIVFSIIISKLANLREDYQLTLNLLILAGRLVHPIAYLANLPWIRGFSFEFSHSSSILLLVLSVFPNLLG